MASSIVAVPMLGCWNCIVTHLRSRRHQQRRRDRGHPGWNCIVTHLRSRLQRADLTDDRETPLELHRDAFEITAPASSSRSP